MVAYVKASDTSMILFLRDLSPYNNVLTFDECLIDFIDGLTSTEFLSTIDSEYSIDTYLHK